jgi:hypothetical protein
MVNPWISKDAKFYYILESDYGVTPQNPAFIQPEVVESVEPELNPSNIKLRGIGNIDLQAIIKGLRSPTLKVDYIPASSAPLALLQYGMINSSSLSIEVYYESTEAGFVNLLFQGCRVDHVTIENAIEAMLKVSAEYWSQNVVPGVGHPGGATYSTDTGMLAWYDSYVKKNTVALERATSWKVDVKNNLKRVPVIRATNGDILKYLCWRNRDISGEVVFEFETKEEYDDIIGDTAFSLEFGIGTAKLSLTGCKWDKVSTPAEEDLISLKAGFTAKTLAMS